MEMLSGAQMVVRALEDEGVDIIFGYPGGAVIDIYDALYSAKKLKHVLVRHEQAAVHAADGYARSTGKVGVALATSGPGATNCVTGIATAYMDSVPLVMITGQVANRLIGSDAFQEVDTVGITRPIVKHSFLCRRAEDLPLIIKKAFYLASTGRPGPVVIDIPKDVQNPKLKFEYEYPRDISMRSYNPTRLGHKGQIKRAVKLLSEVKQPIVYVGGGVVLANASQQVRKLVDCFDLPVVSSLMGLGAISAHDRHFLGLLGMHGTYEANMAMHNADLVLAIGTRFSDRSTNNVEKFCPNAKIIHIDIDPASISKTVRVDIPIVGSIDTVVPQMMEAVDELGISTADRDMGNWWNKIEEWRSKKCLAYSHDENFIKPQEVIEAVNRITGNDAIVVSDVGQHQMFTALYYKFDQPRQWLNSGGLGTMGYGLPAAIGAQIANPDKTVVCFTSDGSIQMNIQELATCTQYTVPLKIVIINNNALGMVKQWQRLFYEGRLSETCSPSYISSIPDFCKLAESYGHVGIRINNPADLDSSMEKAFAIKDKLVVIEVLTDPSEMVYPMTIGGGAMCDMRLSATETTL
ncbi:MAG: biosynthetic-type acetolactate synthase large subunit [Succinivibrionaceae bacterium]